MAELNQSELFIKTLGDWLAKTDPKVVHMAMYEGNVPKRKLVTLGTKIMGAIMMPGDSMGFKVIDFDALWAAYKEVLEKEGRTLKLA